MFPLSKYKLFVIALLANLAIFSCKEDKTSIPFNPPIINKPKPDTSITENYSGTIKNHEWFLNTDSPYYRSHTYFDTCTIAVKHLHSVIDIQKDTIELHIPIFNPKLSETYTIILIPETENSDSINYVESYFSYKAASPLVGILTKYNNPKHIYLEISYYVGLSSGSDIYFSGNKN